MEQSKKVLDINEDLKDSSRSEAEIPRIFDVIIYNDNFTSMDFVVAILQSVFSKSSEIAYKIMMDIHNNGSAVCGSFLYEIAEIKVSQVIEKARNEDYPLRCTIREEI